VTEVTAQMVKVLRDSTSAGMMDCKRALQETDGDFDAAVALLREKGMASAAKRAERATSEGRVAVRVDGSAGTIVAVGCETEPVSANEDFASFVQRVVDAVAAGGDGAVEELEADRVDLAAKLGENIQIVGARRLQASDGEALSQYVHGPANKVGAIVHTRGGDAAVARSLALHLTFARPTYRTRAEVPTDLVEAERQILEHTDEVQSKPENVRGKIVDGMLNKRFFGESVLTDQTWYRSDESTATVAQFLKERGVELVDFAWYAVG
jgi:elongation factor Ts